MTLGTVTQYWTPVVIKPAVQILQKYIFFPGCVQPHITVRQTFVEFTKDERSQRIPHFAVTSIFCVYNDVDCTYNTAVSSGLEHRHNKLVVVFLSYQLSQLYKCVQVQRMPLHAPLCSSTDQQNALHCGVSLSKQWRVSLIARLEYGMERYTSNSCMWCSSIQVELPTMTLGLFIWVWLHRQLQQLQYQYALLHLLPWDQLLS